MDRHTIGTLAHFCASQQKKFDPLAWLSEGAADPKTYAVAAKYLSMTSWYGHDEALERVAMQLCPALAVREEFNRGLLSVELDLQYFSSSVRYRIALRDFGTAPQAGYPLPAPAQAGPETSESLQA